MSGKLRKGVRTRVLRRAASGKPFEPGNSYGLATRFKPGQTGNPGGRPKSTKLSDAIRALLAANVSDVVQVQTNAEAVALRIIKLAKRGNISAAREAGDRAEGRPAVSLSLNDGPDPLTQILAEMTRRYDEKYGDEAESAEGLIPLPEGEPVP